MDGHGSGRQPEYVNMTPVILNQNIMRHSPNPPHNHPGPSHRPPTNQTPPSSIVHHRPQTNRQEIDSSQYGGHFKKFRVLEARPDLQRPLQLDLPPSPAYIPMVEAVSPEDLSTKELLLQRINRVDREINTLEQKIAVLKAKEAEFEKRAQLPNGANDNDDDSVAPVPAFKHQSLAQKIYEENRRKAAQSHAQFDRFGPPIDIPLYNQPSDTAVYHENQRKHQLFKPLLIRYLQKKKKERFEHQCNMAEKYEELRKGWVARIKKYESSHKYRYAQTKHRETFEKVFPELRKQREDKERLSRIGSRVKSEADMEDVVEGLHELAVEEEKLRSCAVVPPMLLDESERKLRFINNNGLVRDMKQDSVDWSLHNIWTDAEIQIFRERFVSYPKNFTQIKALLPKKSVAECVQYYYLSKKREKYKKLLRKSRSGRAKGAKKLSSGITGALRSGVTTRQKNESIQRREVASNLETGESTDPTPPDASDTGSANANQIAEAPADPTIEESPQVEPQKVEHTPTVVVFNEEGKSMPIIECPTMPPIASTSSPIAAARPRGPTPSSPTQPHDSKVASTSPYDASDGMGVDSNNRAMTEPSDLEDSNVPYHKIPSAEASSCYEKDVIRSENEATNAATYPETLTANSTLQEFIKTHVTVPQSPPQSVRDLMANVIEKQLMKSPGGSTNVSSAPPTIASILGTDSFKSTSGDSLATLSIVRPQEEKSLTKDRARDELIVVPFQGYRSHQPEADVATLDLSLKKKDTTMGFQSQGQQMYSKATSSSDSQRREVHYYQPHSSKQPSETPRVIMTHAPRASQMVRSLPLGMPREQPRQPPPIQSTHFGSITHGTPLQGAIRYEGQIRQISSHSKDAGSITKEIKTHHAAPQRNPNTYDCYAPSTSHSPTSRHPTAYEQQLASRQIIFNDYITSQQMHGRRVAEPPMHYPPQQSFMPSHSSADSSSSPQARQGVIQHHNTMSSGHSRVVEPPSHSLRYPPPGHEAFSSLVEVAAQQQSLPVPTAERKRVQPNEQYHEGLGKTIADSLPATRPMEQHRRMHGNLVPEHHQRVPHNHEHDEAIRHYHFLMQQEQRMERRRLEHQNQQNRMAEHHYHHQGFESDGKRQEQARDMQRFAALNHPQQQRGSAERSRHTSEKERHSGRGAVPGARQEPLIQMRAPAPTTLSRMPDERGLTAESLIGAIITREINQTSAPGASGVQSVGSKHTRPGDRLFQAIVRPAQSQYVDSTELQAKRSGSPLERAPVKSLNLNEHINAIIAQDYNLPYAQQRQAMPRREMGDERTIIRMAQSPQNSSARFHDQERALAQFGPTEHAHLSPMAQSSENNSSRFYQERRSYGASEPAHLSPLDYVKSRIAEAMRTPEDGDLEEKGKDGAIESSNDESTRSAPDSTYPYQYPYGRSNNVGSSGNMQAQYEPISDDEE